MYILVSVRKLSIVFLSLLLSYAGAAWALEACLRHDGHSHHSTFENRSEFHAPVAHDHPQDASLPTIHCMRGTHEVGPVARVASAEIPHSDKGAVLDVVSLSDAGSATLK